MGKIYALDVGTRNVVLLSALQTEEEKIKIEDMIACEHETRAMEDGQIHDIAKVAKTVKYLKDQLEKSAGEKIKEVAVAVAGRSLVTSEGYAKFDISIDNEISNDDILKSELVAIQDSVNNLANDSIGYHCVGYTVMEFILDGVNIKSPLYQKGEQLEVKILATFLPKVVVDSMFTMIKKCDLEIKTLTLEPIAAINVVVPEDMRKLNIALVDIGAGTSDIAITDRGKIIGYGMVPIAGDEITEAIENEYLLEFIEAERIKKDLRNPETTVSYTDFLGLENEIEKTEIYEKIDSILEHLTDQISKKILELNEKAPQAVILIGGGSLTPGIKDKIADKITLKAGRVAVRGTEAIKNLVDETDKLKTSEYVTPVGIANMAFKGNGFNVINLNINNSHHRVFSFDKRISLFDALNSSGVDTKNLFSRPGQPLTIKINNKLRIIKGEEGKSASIKINGEKAKLTDDVLDGYHVEIKVPRAGRDAVYYGKDLKEDYPDLVVYLNDEKKIIKRKITLYGKEIKDDYVIQDRDEFNVKEIFNIKDLFNEDMELDKIIKFNLNNQEIEMKVPAIRITRGRKILSLADELYNNDKIRIGKTDKVGVKVRDVVDLDSEQFKITINGKPLILDVPMIALNNGKRVSINDEICNGDNISVGVEEGKYPIISTLLNYVSLDQLEGDPKRGIKILVNDKTGEFTTKIQNGDNVKLYY